MTTLFDPVTFAGVTAANRIVRSATWEGVADEAGGVTDKLVEIYDTLAKNGVGLIVTGFAYIRPDGKALKGQMGIYDDAQVEGLKRIADACHAHDVPVYCQVVHAGLATNPKTLGGAAPLGFSTTEIKGYESDGHVVSTSEIAELAGAFAEAARRVKEAGFDGVQLHMAHGYLISQSLSPLTNRRDDEYGGDPVKRTRFALEVTEAVRKTVGADYPVAAKLNGAEFAEGGLEVVDAVKSAELLVAAGLDWIEVSGGTPASGRMGAARAGIDAREKEGYLRPLARAVRHAVDVPVVSVGGYRSPDVIDDVLQSGDADAVALCRPLICEPELLTRWKEGDRTASRCGSCLGCFKTSYAGNPSCVLRTKAEEKGTW